MLGAWCRVPGTVSGFGVPLFGASTLRPHPSFLAPPFWAPTFFLELASRLRGSHTSGPTLQGSQIQGPAPLDSTFSAFRAATAPRWATLRGTPSAGPPLRWTPLRRTALRWTALRWTALYFSPLPPRFKATIPREDPTEGEKTRNSGRTRGEQRVKCWASHRWGPQPNFWTPLFWVTPFWAPPFLAPTFFCDWAARLRNPPSFRAPIGTTPGLGARYWVPGARYRVPGAPCRVRSEIFLAEVLLRHFGLLQGALVILVRLHTSPFWSFGK